MDIEINVPISPTPGFLNRLHYFIRSWELSENSKRRYRLIVTVGDDQEPFDLRSLASWMWSRDIEVRWVDRQLFRDQSFYATGLERFRQPYEADLVLLADADMLFAGSIGEARNCVSANGIAGVMSFASPFFNDKLPGTSKQWWQKIYAAARLPPPQLRYLHSMARPEGHDRAPVYYNFGFLLMRRETCARIGQLMFDEVANVDRVLETFFRAQIALTLAIERLNLEIGTLPLRFNHPLGHTDKEFAEEWKDARVFHYTGSRFFSADTDGESEATVERWLRAQGAEPLSGVNAKFFEILERTHRLLVES